MKACSHRALALTHCCQDRWWVEVPMCSHSASAFTFHCADARKNEHVLISRAKRCNIYKVAVGCSQCPTCDIGCAQARLLRHARCKLAMNIKTCKPSWRWAQASGVVYVWMDGNAVHDAQSEYPPWQPLASSRCYVKAESHLAVCIQYMQRSNQCFQCVLCTHCILHCGA